MPDFGAPDFGAYALHVMAAYAVAGLLPGAMIAAALWRNRRLRARLDTHDNDGGGR